MKQQRPLEGLCLLIVEDAGMTAVNIVRVLQERGGAIAEIVRSLSEAQRQLQSTRYDMVLLDHGLDAKEHGTDLALWLMHQEREELRRIIRVSYSGTERDTILNSVPAEDADTLFAAMYTKPVPLRDLMALLHDLAVKHGKIRV
jgi:DNA-binding response OmpR family regulator